MAAADRMQTQRFELNYLLSEDKAITVRDFIRSYLELDEYCAIRPSFLYPVHSIYLDSDDLGTCWETINGDKKRFEFRSRNYN